MKIGLQVVRFNWSGSPANIGTTLKDIAQAAEGAGFDSLWVMDHYYQLPGLGRIEDPMLEGYSALNFMAAVTERVKLGTMVSGVIYREPASLIKAATTLDVLSGGRAYFGVGAAWFEREALGMGFPFPPVKERFERLAANALRDTGCVERVSADGARHRVGACARRRTGHRGQGSLKRPHSPQPHLRQQLSPVAHTSLLHPRRARLR